MIKSNFHTHTLYCDGKNTPEEMIKSAIDKGFKSLGFSTHSPMNFENDYECSLEDLPKYVAEINQLKDKYKNIIEIYSGIELDADYSEFDKSQFDYIIGAVHQLHCNGKVYYIDLSKERFLEVINKEFGGDPIAMAKQYYSSYAKFVCEEKPDVVAHFDLIEKFNDDKSIFDSDNSDYQLIATMYLERICFQCPDIIFEINTGAMYRCGNSKPYPSPFLMKTLKKHNMKIAISSDSHNTESLDYKFEEMVEYCKSFGFTENYVLLDGKFQPTAL